MFIYLLLKISIIMKISMTRIFLMFFLCFYSIICPAKTNTSIKTVQFTGLKNISVSEVLDHINIYKDHTMTVDEIKNNTKKLLDMGVFKYVTSSNLKDKIVFKCKEYPVIFRILCRGNIKIHKHTILKQCRLIGIKSNHVFNTTLIGKLKHNLKKLYDQRGFYGTKIHISHVCINHDFIVFKIHIFEGLPKILNNINITGNKSFSNYKITSLMKSYPNFFQRNIYHNKEYNDHIFNKDLRKLKHFYHQNGYINFCISNVKVITLKNKKNIIINVTISEGSQYFLSSLKTRGNLKNYDDTFKNELSNIQLKNKYNIYDVIAVKKHLEDIFLNLGFLKCKIILNTHVDKINKHVSVYFDTDLGERFIINKIKIQGYKLKSDLFFYHLLKPLSSGSYVNLKLIQLGKHIFEDTGYMKDVSTCITVVPDSLNKVDLIYVLKPNKTNDHDINMGYNERYGLNFNINFRHNNWIGRGIDTITNILYSQKCNNFDFIVRYPNVLHDMILSHHIFYNTRSDVDENTEVSHQSYGLEENMQFLKSKYHVIKISANYNKYDYLYYGKPNSLQPQLFNLNNKESTPNQVKSNVSVSYTWLYNTMSQFHFPFSGKKILFIGKLACDNNNAIFHKETISFDEYFPLLKCFKCILRTRINSGISCLLFSGNAPYYEGYHIQNSDNIRGFINNSLGPSKIKNQDFQNYRMHPEDQSKNHHIMGGNSFIVGKFDLIIPNFFILKHQYDKYFQTSLFFDIGNIDNISWKNAITHIFDKFQYYNLLKNFRSSTGMEVAWNSMIGPLHIVYSYPLLYKIKDLLQVIEYNMYD